MDLHKMCTPVLAPKSFWDSSLGEQKTQEAAANHLGEWRDALFLEGQHSSRRPRARRALGSSGAEPGVSAPGAGPRGRAQKGGGKNCGRG